ncbi:MAG: fused MFS/spermidine synthase, partial [Acidobacteria bacterium]|nr:fused MFS/spermidine synthase [Acidobacteriota bacterium]
VFTLLLIVHWRSDAAGVRVISRNFFGVKKVFDQGGYRILRHGRIVHGQQSLDPARRGEPTSYYARDTGINLLLTGYPRTNPWRVGVVGLGTGTLAAYGQPGDYYRFYEIDPDVTALSRSESPEFTFLRDSRARVEVIAGDARLALERELRRPQPQQFDVLVLDAFSSDSIPVHLLTREAFRIYVGHLRGPDSVLAVHISNRFLDLALVVAGLAADAGLNSAQVKNAGADWVLLSRRPAMLRLPGLRDHAQPVALDRPPRLWTDDFSNIFQALKR